MKLIKTKRITDTHKPLIEGIYQRTSKNGMWEVTYKIYSRPMIPSWGDSDSAMRFPDNWYDQYLILPRISLFRRHFRKCLIPKQTIVFENFAK